MFGGVYQLNDPGSLGHVLPEGCRLQQRIDRCGAGCYDEL